MNTITLEELKGRDYNTKKISNYRLSGCCMECCKEFVYSSVKKFMSTRNKCLDKKNLWHTCQKCWLSIRTYKDPVWIKKNSDAQLIAQNKPEQKKKNAEGVSRSWTKERKLKASQILKTKWKEDEGFAKSALKNLDWTAGGRDDKFRDFLRNSVGIGGLRGEYNGMSYDSALELSYILWCEEENIEIKRYDLPGVDYTDENGQSRKYFPDFIIDNDTVVEIKGLGIYYKLNYLRNIKKLEALKSKFAKHKFILSSDKCVKCFYKKARRLHHANKKEKKNKIQGESE